MIGYLNKSQIIGDNMKNNKMYLPYLSGVGYAIIFGFSFMFSRVGLRDASTMQLVGLRFLAAAGLIILLKVFNVIHVKLTIKDFLRIVPISLFLPVLYFIGETYGILHTSASLSGMVISSIPIITAVLSFIFIKERLSVIQIIFMGVSLIGVLLISIMTLSDASSSIIMGMIFLFIACLSAAIYNVMARKLTKRYSPIEITYVMMIVAAVVFNVVGVTESLVKEQSYFAPFQSASFCWSVLFLGFLSSIGAFFLMNYTVSKIKAAQNSMFANLVTVVAIIAGVVFLKESITIYQIIGSLLIIVGVWGINKYAEQPTPDRHIV